MLFMLDSGAAVIIVRVEALHPETVVHGENVSKMGGITPGSMTTWGTVTLTMKGSPYTFHVVPNNFLRRRHHREIVTKGKRHRGFIL